MDGGSRLDDANSSKEHSQNISDQIDTTDNQNVAAISTTEDDRINENEEFVVENNDSGHGKSDMIELHDNKRVTGEDNRIPHVGMVFNSYAEAVNFYKRYAMRVGFGVTIKKSSFNTFGLCRRLVLVCTKEGKGRGNACYQSRPTAKTNCEATLVAKLWGDGLLHVVEANLEHNHELNPSAARFFRCYKKLPTGMTKDQAVRSAGRDDLPNIDKECLDFIEGGIMKLTGEDKNAIHHFFSRMQAKYPNFFYLLDLDAEGHLRNVFWSDSRSRMAYQYYGDVMYFDSAYIRNKYKIPLAIFVGSNNHGQLVLLGCGLLSDETSENYSWLFKTWQTCMLDRPPSALITDQSLAVRSAVSEVFPMIKHRICLWNITRSIPEKLKDCTEWKTIENALTKVIYNSLKVDEFEEGWRDLTKTYGLGGNEWLNWLYENRQSWAPVFLKGTFWAGLSTTRREDTQIAFFEGYVSQETSMREFLSNYEIIMQTKYEFEAESDFASFQKSQLLVSKYPMEEQLSKLYTLEMFDKFQNELKATVYCQVSLLKVDGSVSTFEVKECEYRECDDRSPDQGYEVFYRVGEYEVECVCGYFRFTGILCRHALSVLTLQQVYEIPSHYVLSRWRKDVKQLHTLGHLTNEPFGDKQKEPYHYLSMHCLQLVEISMISDEKYQLALKLIEGVEKTLLDDNMCRDLQHRILSSETRLNGSNENHPCPPFGIANGNTASCLQTKRRGRPPKKRKESEAETNLPTEILTSNNDSIRALADGSHRNLFQSTSAASHLDRNNRMNGGVDLMEEVSADDLSSGSHFGLHGNPQHHLHEQHRSGHTLQSSYGQQHIGSQSRVQWLYQQMLQEDQMPFGRRTGPLGTLTCLEHVMPTHFNEGETEYKREDNCIGTDALYK